MDIIISLLHLCQAGLTAKAASLSYKSIDALSGGDTARRAAKYSNKAAFQVFHVQGTQTAGAISLATSLLLSIFLAVCAAVPGVTIGPPVGGRLALNVAETFVVAGSTAYIRSLWKARAKIPSWKADDYNMAITTTNDMRELMFYLALLWALTGALEALHWAF